MEIRSSLENKTLSIDVLNIFVTPKDRDKIVEVLKALVKRSKPDRLDAYVVESLISAFENPVVPPKEVKSRATLREVAEPKLVTMPEESNKGHVKVKGIDDATKASHIASLKNRFDPTNVKAMPVFIKESIDFGQKQMGIKTVPKSEGVSAFWDWLYEVGIIDVNGNPKGKG